MDDTTIVPGSDPATTPDMPAPADDMGAPAPEVPAEESAVEESTPEGLM